ncbi:MAG: hypothetical protein ACK4K9_00675 [Bacteroidia bacterium]
MNNKFQLVVLLVFSLKLSAQQADLRNYNENKSARGTYIGASAGINNPAGLIGFRLNQGLTRKTMLDLGIGFGSWGTKISAAAILNADKERGIVPVLGLTYASGIEKLSLDSMDMINNNLPNKPVERINIDAKLQPTIAANLGIQWQFYSKKGNRIFADFGYTLYLGGGNISYKPEGYQPTDFTDAVIKFLRPGGIMVGLSYVWLR